MAELTDAEAAVYDRQLRVWGVEVQKRLRSARVLIVGCSGLAAEVAKNIVLAGVGSLHLADDTPSAEAAATNFLNYSRDAGCSVAEASARSLREMNPMVSTAARSVPADPSKDLAAEYDVILVVGWPLGSLAAWDAACREAGTAFFAAVSRGTLACFFADLGTHTFVPAEEEGKGQEPETVSFAPLADALRQSWAGLKPARSHQLLPVLLLCAPQEAQTRAFPPPSQQAALLAAGQARAAGEGAAPSLLQPEPLAAYLAGSEEFAPVNAIVGGVLANELLKAVSKKGRPLNNLFVYSLADGGGVVERLAPPAQ